jgi:pyridoxal phosphate enzyme (YggS family)
MTMWWWMELKMSSIKENIENIYKRIRLTCEKSGRSPDDIILVAATKTVDADRINEAIIGAGIKVIGENRVQEFRDKYDYILPSAKKHFIGHLQTNKVKYIVGKADLIESADSEKLLDEIDRCAKKLNIVQKALIEVNASGEETKFGFDPDEVEKVILNNENRENVKLCGLMTIGPNTENDDEIRKVFRDLYNLYLDISRKKYHNSSMEFLSMGMSADFEIAVEEGANIIRIGSAIFGKRI